MVDFPNTPNDGDYHTEEGATWQYRTDRWVVATQASGTPQPVGNITYGPTLPPDPAPGDMHYITTEPTGLFVWMNDGDSDQWVQTNGALGQAPVDNIYPVGSIYMSVSSANPGTLWPGTTWLPFAEGRVMVGVGDNGESNWGNQEVRGSEEHTLVTGEIPNHLHGEGTLTTNSTGAHNHDVYYQDSANGGGSQNTVSGSSGADGTQGTSSAGAHSHTVTGETGSTGGGGAHNNVQPSIATYIWQRTA